jgi:hypothetical protein
MALPFSWTSWTSAIKHVYYTALRRPRSFGRGWTALDVCPKFWLKALFTDQNKLAKSIQVLVLPKPLMRCKGCLSVTVQPCPKALDII